jgi:hypothetical protein
MPLPPSPPLPHCNDHQPCNNSGFTDPKRTVGWAVIDFDWSNAKALWVAQRPMNDEELLQQQVCVCVCVWWWWWW